MRFNQSKNSGLLIGYLIISVLLCIFKNYRLETLVLPDYDSASNFLVGREIAAGNFTNMFRHASPTFNLLTGLALAFTTRIFTLAFLNNALAIVSSIIFCRFAAHEFKLHNWQELVIFILAGTSVTVTFLGRGLSFEPMGMLGFSVFFVVYYYSFKKPESRYFYLAVLVFSVLLTVNYKVLVLLPIIAVIELFQKDRQHHLRTWLYAFLIPVFVFAFYSLLSFWLGFGLVRYAAVAAAIAFNPDDHPYRDPGFFNFDVLFYIKYLFQFENPLLLLSAVVFPFTLKWNEILKNRKITPELYLFIFIYCILAGMSVIQKAPRGIIFAYPLLYITVILNLKHFNVKKYASIATCAVMVLINLYLTNLYVYNFSGSHYAELADYLKKSGINKVAVTVSKQIIPLLPPDADVNVLNHHSQFPDLKKAGYNYLIIDDYYRITCMNLKPKYKKIIKAYREKPLLNPIFALEHCEYSGLNFNEALQISDSLNAKPYQLLLVEL